MNPALLTPKYLICLEITVDYLDVMEMISKEAEQKDILMFSTFPCTHPIHVSKSYSILLLKLQYLHLYLEWWQHKIET